MRAIGDHIEPSFAFSTAIDIDIPVDVVDMRKTL